MLYYPQYFTDIIHYLIGFILWTQFYSKIKITDVIPYNISNLPVQITTKTVQALQKLVEIKSTLYLVKSFDSKLQANTWVSFICIDVGVKSKTMEIICR